MAGAVQVNSISEFIMFNAFFQSIAVGCISVLLWRPVGPAVRCVLSWLLAWLGTDYLIFAIWCSLCYQFCGYPLNV